MISSAGALDCGALPVSEIRTCASPNGQAAKAAALWSSSSSETSRCRRFGGFSFLSLRAFFLSTSVDLPASWPAPRPARRHPLDL